MRTPFFVAGGKDMGQKLDLVCLQRNDDLVHRYFIQPGGQTVVPAQKFHAQARLLDLGR